MTRRASGRPRRGAYGRARRARQAAHSRWWSNRGSRTLGVSVIAILTIASVVLIASQRGRAVPSASATRLRVQRYVAALYAGIPQHGVVLGQSAAPVTLQVFVDLEDHTDGTRWFDVMLPPIINRFVKTNILRLEFRSFKTDTLNRRPFFLQQVSALAAGRQNLLWDYVTTFMNEQGTEFTNYVSEQFVTGVAEQIPGLNLAKWRQSRTNALTRVVAADNNTAIRVGFHDSPSFRIGLTGGKMDDFVGNTIETYHKYIVRTRPSGERYISGVSNEWQHPVSLVDAADVKKVVEKLI